MRLILLTAVFGRRGSLPTVACVGTELEVDLGAVEMSSGLKPPNQSPKDRYAFLGIANTELPWRLKALLGEVITI